MLRPPTLLQERLRWLVNGVFACVMCASVEAQSPRAVAPSDTSLRIQAGARYATSAKLHTGDVVVISATRPIEPDGMISGIARIRSATTGYDSGDRRLISERDGRSLYMHWETVAVKPAPDYTIDVTVELKNRQTESRSLTVPVIPVTPEEAILERSTDLALPYWDIGLAFIRRFRYESGYGIYRGSLGYGWIHSYGMILTENTDGSVSIFDTNTGGGHFYRPKTGDHFGRDSTPGTYHSTPSDASRLTRDADGSFLLRVANGDLWRFRSDLRLSSLQDPRGRRVSLEYGRDGLLSSVSDDAGQRIEFAYDTQGRVIHAFDNIKRSVKYAYDVYGDLEHVSDVAGETTSYRYDNQHRLVETHYPDGRRRIFAYGADGRLSRTSLDSGFRELTFMYHLSNSTHGERTIKDAMGRITRELSEGDGYLTERQDALGHSATRRYDRAFRPTRFSDARSNTWRVVAADSAGLLTLEDADGNSSMVSASPSDGRVQTVSDGNGFPTRFVYDRTGAVSKLSYADLSADERFVSDAVDTFTVTHRRRDGSSNRYVFDARGLLTRKELSDRSVWQYRYDTAGSLIEATNNSGSVEMRYDARGRITRASFPGQRAFTYSYDARSRRTRLINPDGETLTYRYSVAGALASIESLGERLASYEYNAALQPTRRTALEYTTDLRYDTVGYLTSLNTKRHGLPVASWEYELDADGFRKWKDSRGDGDRYYYYNGGALRQVRYGDGFIENFEYDGAGNRKSIITDGVTVPIYVDKVNAYVRLASDTMIFDLNGQLIRRASLTDTTNYGYDPEGRLIRVERTGRAAISYSYDALGRLRTRSVAGQTTLYLWDGLQLAMEEDSTHRTLRTFTWGAGATELVQTRQNDTVSVVLQDALGSVTEIGDRSGKNIDHYRFRAFGAPMSDTGSKALRIGFAGAVYDVEARLSLFGFRWYSPYDGRFITPDPIGLAGGLNLYIYAGNDPVNRTDYFGLTGGRGVDQGFWIPTDDERDCVHECPLLGVQINSPRDGFGRRVVHDEATAPREGTMVVAGDGVGIMISSTTAAGAGKRGLRFHTSAPGPVGEPIRAADSTFAHIERYYVVGGAGAGNHSVFDAKVDLRALMHAAEGVAPLKQPVGPNFIRVVNAGRQIGVYAPSGRRTTTYAVITKPSGDLVLMYPTSTVPQDG